MKRILTLLILAALMPAMLTLPAIASERNFPPITEGCGDHIHKEIYCTGQTIRINPIACPLQGKTADGISHPDDCTLDQYYCGTRERCRDCFYYLVDLEPHYCYIDHAAAGITVHVCENSLRDYN